MPWMKLLFDAQLDRQFPLPAGVDEIARDAPAPLRYRVEFDESEGSSDRAASNSADHFRRLGQLRPHSLAAVDSTTRLTAPDWTQVIDNRFYCFENIGDVR